MSWTPSQIEDRTCADAARAGRSLHGCDQGRLTGQPGLCISTLGPGALNFTTGAAYAHLGAMPMLMITGQKAIKSARQARFQIVNIVAAMRPLTKMTRQIVSPASIPTIVRDAFRVAVEERPGPCTSNCLRTSLPRKPTLAWCHPIRSIGRSHRFPHWIGLLR